MKEHTVIIKNQEESVNDFVIDYFKNNGLSNPKENSIFIEPFIDFFMGEIGLRISVENSDDLLAHMSIKTDIRKIKDEDMDKIRNNIKDKTGEDI